MTAGFGMNNVELAIVLPVFNERSCILEALRQAEEIANRVSNCQIIVVDDGSTDGTGEMLDEQAKRNNRVTICHQINSGHGAAVLKGYREAIKMGAEWIFQLDSDNKFEVKDFLKLWELRQRSVFILGNRLGRKDPIHRKIVTNGAKILNLLLFGVWIPDANIPFRLMEASFLEGCLQQLGFDPFAPNIWLSVLAAKKGVPLLNIPIQNLERISGQSAPALNNILRIGFICVGDAIRLRWRLI